MDGQMIKGETENSHTKMYMNIYQTIMWIPWRDQE